MNPNDEWNTIDISNSIWVVPKRYSNLKPFNRGAYGLVCLADDSVSNQKVAIKKLSQSFSTDDSSKKAFREIKILKHMKHENVIRLFDIFTNAKTPEEMENVYLVTNFMDYDLDIVMKNIPLKSDQIKSFVYSLLRGLKYIHTSNLIHRDLKPANITINQDSALRIIDFGLSRTEKEIMTDYVVTRHYRAPEIILNKTNYTKAVDIWSVGCIMAEMFLARTIFPGTDNLEDNSGKTLVETKLRRDLGMNQLNIIIEICGFPSDNFINFISEQERSYLLKLSKRPERLNFAMYFGQIKDNLAIDLLDKILVIDPRERITCEEALKHPYLESLHDIEDEPEGSIFDDSYELENFNFKGWKRKVFEEIASFIPPEDYNDI